MSNIRLLKGDCIKQLKVLKDNSVDSVVTDPPYEIGFMGKGWDDSGIANNPELWKEVLRVLKPGGHLLSFSHSRTYHRQAVAVEDAGFDIRDQIMWVYGSGFPKSHNIGKSVDKLLGNEREVVATTNNIKLKSGPMYEGWQSADRIQLDITKGTSQYEGWGTALKPAHEPIVMARKPLSEKTVAKNVLEYGTGGINIDGCRVGYSETNRPIPQLEQGKTKVNSSKTMYDGQSLNKSNTKAVIGGNLEGRFPANIIFDEEAGKILDEQSGTKSGNSKGAYTYKDNEYQVEGFINNIKPNSPSNYGDTGGASRFFYCPKASRKDRNEGVDDLDNIPKNSAKMWDVDGSGEQYNPNKRDGKGNFHPTVKPTELMAYLIRLVTPKGGVVLDPFMGSGSTGKAAVREGVDFIGIEREKEYMKIAKTRIEHEKGKHKHREFFDAI